MQMQWRNECIFRKFNFWSKMSSRRVCVSSGFFFCFCHFAMASFVGYREISLIFSLYHLMWTTSCVVKCMCGVYNIWDSSHTGEHPRRICRAAYIVHHKHNLDLKHHFHASVWVRVRMWCISRSCITRPMGAHLFELSHSNAKITYMSFEHGEEVADVSSSCGHTHCHGALFSNKNIDASQTKIHSFFKTSDRTSNTTPHCVRVCVCLYLFRICHPNEPLSETNTHVYSDPIIIIMPTDMSEWTSWGHRMNVCVRKERQWRIWPTEWANIENENNRNISNGKHLVSSPFMRRAHTIKCDQVKIYKYICSILCHEWVIHSHASHFTHATTSSSVLMYWK